MSFFDFSSIINNYNPTVVQNTTNNADKNKEYQKDKSEQQDISNNYVEKQRTIEQLLLEQGIEATQRNKEIAKALYKHNQMINQQNLEYVKKVMEQFKFNNAIAYEAYVILFTNSIEISQRNLDAVQSIIQDKNVILEVKELTSKIDELNKIIDKAVEDEIKKLEENKQLQIKQDISNNDFSTVKQIEEQITKKLINDLYNNSTKKIDKIENNISTEIKKLDLNTSDLSESKVIDLDIINHDSTSKPIIDIEVSNKSQNANFRENDNLQQAITKNTIKENNDNNIKLTNTIENNALTIDKNIKQENNISKNIETKISTENTSIDNSKNFFKDVNKKISDILENKFYIKTINNNQENNIKNNDVKTFNSSSLLDKNENKIEGFEYHLRNTGMSDDAKDILKNKPIIKQEVNSENEPVITLIPQNSNNTKISLPIKSLLQETKLVENQPVFVNLDGKPRLVIKDKTGFKVLLVNLDVVKKVLGLIKPETAKIIDNNGVKTLLFKDFNNIEKNIPINDKILIKDDFSRPKLITKSGENNLIVTNSSNNETYIIPTKYFINNAENTDNSFINKIDFSQELLNPSQNLDIVSSSKKTSTLGLNSDLLNVEFSNDNKNNNTEKISNTNIKNSIFSSKEESSIIKNKVQQASQNINIKDNKISEFKPQLTSNIIDNDNNLIPLVIPNDLKNENSKYSISFNKNNVKIDVINEKDNKIQEIKIDKNIFDKLAIKNNLNENKFDTKTKVIEINTKPYLINNSRLVDLNKLPNNNLIDNPEFIFIDNKPNIIFKNNNNTQIVNLDNKINESELNLIQNSNLKVNYADNNLKLTANNNNQSFTLEILNPVLNEITPQILNLNGESVVLIKDNNNFNNISIIPTKDINNKIEDFQSNNPILNENNNLILNKNQIKNINTQITENSFDINKIDIENNINDFNPSYDISSQQEQVSSVISESPIHSSDVLSNKNNLTSELANPKNNELLNLNVDINKNTNILDKLSSIDLKKEPLIIKDKNTTKIIYTDNNDNIIELNTSNFVDKINSLRNKNIVNIINNLVEKDLNHIFKINNEEVFISNILDNKVSAIPIKNVLEPLNNNNSNNNNLNDINIIELQKNKPNVLKINNDNFVLLNNKNSNNSLNLLKIDKNITKELPIIQQVVLNDKKYIITNFNNDNNIKNSNIKENYNLGIFELDKSPKTKLFNNKNNNNVIFTNYDNKSLLAIGNLFGNNDKVLDISIDENHSFLKPFSDPIFNEDGELIIKNDVTNKPSILSENSIKTFLSSKKPNYQVITNNNGENVIFKDSKGLINLYPIDKKQNINSFFIIKIILNLI
ncbi:MAG: hypothetical protein U0457_05455 [Candidatus Sericytochromatia bacterium]